MAKKLCKRITVSLSEKEFERLEEAIKKDGSTRSEFVRRMIVKKYCKNDPPETDRKMTKRERAFVQSSIRKQLAEYERKHGIEMDAMILYDLHVLFGFGRNRLKIFYDHFGEDIHDLIDRYEDENIDKVWLAAERLKEDTGIDIRLWAKEKEKKLSKNGE